MPRTRAISFFGDFSQRIAIAEIGGERIKQQIHRIEGVDHDLEHRLEIESGQEFEVGNAFGLGNEVRHREQIAERAAEKSKCRAGEAEYPVDTFANHADCRADDKTNANGEPADLVSDCYCRRRPDRRAEDCGHEPGQNSHHEVLFGPEPLHRHQQLRLRKSGRLICSQAIAQIVIVHSGSRYQGQAPIHAA